jgi:SWI/SNF-related matrix-associated actin-dependent regulator 1 of chromatin subfamily A
MYDLDFNPHNDSQAEDRAHRVGQKRDVYVHKLVLEGTVEESILKCAQQKIQLDKRIRGEDDSLDMESMEDEKVLDILRSEMQK